MKLKSYAAGKWIEGSSDGKPLYDASTGELVAVSDSSELDFEEMFTYGRKKGNPVLRKMSFQERGLMLKRLALHLFDLKEKYYPISYKTGATKADSWIDIEGGIGNLFAYSSLRRKFPDQPYFVDGEPASLSKEGGFIGHHIMVPKEGVALHINAFNFPIWGMLEKCAVNWLAGVPAIVKPASISSFLAEAMARDIIKSGILPEGAFQIICGSAHGILNSVNSQDIVTFTGSAKTGRQLKSHDRIISESVPFNMEADSLNCSVLAEDASPGSPEFEFFIKEVKREMTVKCGQKCTAIRRVIVPENYLEDVQIELGKELSKTVIGDPRTKGVRMGALAAKEQLEEVRSKIRELMKSAELVYGDLESVSLQNGDPNTGAFLSPIVLRQNNPVQHAEIHEIEAFGPVCTLMPYHTLDEAVTLSKMGKGSLCCSIATYDDKTAREFVVSAATHHGRILVLNRESAKESTGHGSPMPLLVHGGPGRAGGGEELGGLRGVKHYLQRCALQGTPTTITEITQQYQVGGKTIHTGKHPFQKYFDDLVIGESIKTHKRTITSADIVNFANVSWDHFYAHTDVTSLEETPFDKPVAHGYFILSAAAGLFVHPAKGPVLLNYGLEECRFTKPVYPGMTIGVRLTVKEKKRVEQKGPEDTPKGIVKFLVEVYDETGEIVAIATILTMFKRKTKGKKN